MGEPYDDLNVRIDLINQARRHLGQSVDASGHLLRRALQGTYGARLRPPIRALSVYSAVVVIVAMSVVAVFAVLTVVLERRWPIVRPRVAEVSAEPRMMPRPVSDDRAVRDGSFVVHVLATRPCRVRMVVDGLALDWRQLKDGDELVSRPHDEILIESNDAGAVAATFNGRLIPIGEDHRAAVFRLTSKELTSRFQTSAE